MAAEDKEAFLARWSRLKQEPPREAPLPEKSEALPAAALPPTDSLTPASDFAPFMQPKVTDALRRIALKKLFADPHFNVPDLNEAFSGDWTGGEPISEELLKSLNQARTVLFREEEERKNKDEEARRLAEATPERKDDDGPARQDA